MSDLRWYPPALIDESALAVMIRSLPRFGKVRYSVGTDSTQLRAFEVLQRLDALGISFVTESQDMGRGRAGRRWSSPPASGLLLSTILPFELQSASLPAVGFWTALCVASAVEKVCGITLAFKWPNDLLLGGLKCAGILSEGRSAGASTRVVVGVGLNVNRPAQVPAEIETGSAWISDGVGKALDRTSLLATILAMYEAEFNDLTGRPANVIARWAKRAELDGKRVSVKAPDGTTLHEGIVQKISSDGALVLKTEQRVVTVMLGDVDILG